jgi:hypothetical protein
MKLYLLILLFNPLDIWNEATFMYSKIGYMQCLSPTISTRAGCGNGYGFGTGSKIRHHTLGRDRFRWFLNVTGPMVTGY